MRRPDALALSVIRPDFERFNAKHGAEYERLRGKGGSALLDESQRHEWLGPYQVAGKGTYYLGMNPMHQVVISRLMDLPAAGQAELLPKGAQQPGIWKGLGNRDWFGPLTLAEGEYWMQGDDRDNSADSRYFGPVSEEKIRGRPLLRHWPISRIGFVK